MSRDRCCILSKFYIKPQPILLTVQTFASCILSKFYIKPQPERASNVSAQGCILSKFYIKPQPGAAVRHDGVVVSYRNSTSNHNWKSSIVFSSLLYLIEILHQTTTCQEQHKEQQALYLIEILHQTTTLPSIVVCCRRCILSKFYIKPQLRRKCPNFCCRCILSKFYIKPQPWSIKVTPTIVVSYRNSTSNHNNGEVTIHVRQVVSYRNSTSNHNSSEPAVPAWMLYLIEILHQTTTRHLGCRGRRGLYLIEILHQTTTIGRCFFLEVELYLIEILHQTTTCIGLW